MRGLSVFQQRASVKGERGRTRRGFFGVRDVGML
jgi:hypothetical protein